MRPGAGDFEQKSVLLVTGSSSGIGRACCDRLAQRHFAVYGCSRRVCEPDRWSHLQADVTDDHSLAAAIDRVLAQEGRIDALVHCAGTSLAGALEDVTIEEAKGQFETNFFGTVRAIRAVLAAMRRQRSGKIIVIGSIGGLIGLPYIAHYTATKFAIDGLVQALRAEIMPFGIEATVVHPGDTNTAISDNQVHARGADAGSPYHVPFRRTIEFYDRLVRQARPPDAVARVIERLLARRRLAPRYVIGSPTEVMAVRLKSYLPPRSFEYIFRRAYRL
jgi:NAD(P)-dependent dehydrogenase (short-subunit alcohol dehydrogenase family)